MSKILIIEDNKIIADYLLNILKTESYFLEIAYSGKKALENLKNNNFDLVLLNIILPDKEGIKTLIKLRKNFSPNLLPVIIISGISDEIKIANMLALGANDFITKPISEVILKIKIKYLLQLREKSIELLKHNEVLKSIIDNLPIFSIVISNDVRVLYKNKAFVAQFPAQQIKYKELLGNTVNCLNAVKSNGKCGKTKECKKCIIRNSVNETLLKGSNIIKREGKFTILTNEMISEWYLQVSATRIDYQKKPVILLNITVISQMKLEQN